MEVRKRNKLDDMKLLLPLGEDYNGEEFTATFFSGSYKLKTYKCGYEGGVYENCEPVDNNSFLFFLDNHGLPVGTLYVELRVCYPDTQMPDGNFRINKKKKVVAKDTKTGELYNIEITNEESDDSEVDEIAFSLLGTALRGATGERGPQGIQGERGVPGKDGYTPQKNIDYFDGIDGKDGKDGYTPQKGKDYFDGEKGQKGDKGEPFRYSDFTAAQLESLRGPRGYAGSQGPKGDQGEPGIVKLEELTPEQLKSLISISVEVDNNGNLIVTT